MTMRLLRGPQEALCIASGWALRACTGDCFGIRRCFGRLSEDHVESENRGEEGERSGNGDEGDEEGDKEGEEDEEEKGEQQQQEEENARRFAPSRQNGYL